MIGESLADLQGLRGLDLKKLQMIGIRFEHDQGLALTPFKKISDALHSANVGGDVAEALGVTLGKVGHHLAGGLMIVPAAAGSARAAFHGVEIHAGVQEGSQDAGFASLS